MTQQSIKIKSCFPDPHVMIKRLEEDIKRGEDILDNWQDGSFAEKFKVIQHLDLCKKNKEEWVNFLTML